MGKYVIRRGDSGVRFVLKAGNGEIIGQSEGYTSLVACKRGLESVRKNAPTAALEDHTRAYVPCRNPRFELYKDKAGEYRFRLRAKNGKIILTGESYKQRAGCLNGIASVRKNAPSPLGEE